MLNLMRVHMTGDEEDDIGCEMQVLSSKLTQVPISRDNEKDEACRDAKSKFLFHSSSCDKKMRKLRLNLMRVQSSTFI